jgi:hypothetical protein
MNVYADYMDLSDFAEYKFQNLKIFSAQPVFLHVIHELVFSN